MLEYLIIFAAGFAGSVHCLAMCGGLACALGRDPRGPRATLLRHLIYNSGRVTTYVFLGALAGWLGLSLAQTGLAPLVWVQRLLSVVAGTLIIYIGMQYLGVLAARPLLAGPRAGNGIVVGFRALLQAPGHGAPLSLGVANGFLPCPLVYAFVAQAAAGADIPGGILTMLFFGLGTFPAMLLSGGLGNWFRRHWRQRGLRLAGGFLLLVGLITVARAMAPLTHQHGVA